MSRVTKRTRCVKAPENGGRWKEQVINVLYFMIFKEDIFQISRFRKDSLTNG